MLRYTHAGSVSKKSTKFSDSEEPTGKLIVVHEKAEGVSGTEKFGNIYNEDYFRTLQGSKKADEYDKMRRGDARVKMCLSAVKNPIRSASWSWQASGTDEAAKKHADFLNFIFNKDIGKPGKRMKRKKTLINEALTAVDFGFAVFERVHKTGCSNKQFGQYIGLKDIGWRSPKTLEYFKTDEEGFLTGIEQQAQGDIKKTATMDAQFLNIITIEQEGDNLEGVSLLRPCYGAWKRKELYLKLMAIGAERWIIPTAKAEVPDGKQNSPEYTNLVNTLKALTSHQMNYVTYPEGWEIDFLESSFDPDKFKSIIQFENEEMTFAFLANFLLLGAGGNAGAYSLSADLSKFFTKSIMYIADLISEEFNEIGKELINLNFGEQENYPTLVAQGITDEIGTEYATMIKSLTDSKHLTPDNNVEQELRRRMKLPPMREEDLEKRDREPVKVEPTPNPDPKLTEKDFAYWLNKSEAPAWVNNIRLAEGKAQKRIVGSQDKVRGVMQKHLSLMGADLVNKVMRNYKALPDADKDSAINDVSVSGKRAYYDELKSTLAEIALDSIEEARNEVPKAKKVKLAEFKKLPIGLQKRISSQLRLITTNTVADLEKAVFFQFGDSVVSTDSAATITMDLESKVENFVKGSSVSTAGGNAGSRIVNEARNAFFFDDEVLEEIESFTFINGDPTAPICQDLAGQTFSKGDVEARRLFPPLHHNCESYLSVNLRGAKNNPPITGLKTKHEPVF